MAKKGRPPGQPKKTQWEKACDGMNRVANNESPDWGDIILDYAMRRGLRIEFFDVSEINIESPDCQPKNPKSWGSRTQLWISQGWCKKTGIIVYSKTSKGHAHKLCQLQSLIFKGKKLEQPK